MNRLILYTFIGNNSADYAENLKQYCESLKSGCNKIEYRCFRTINNRQYPETERVPIGWEHIEDVEAHPVSNSYSHALSIHRALDFIYETNDRFNVLIDADTCVAMQGWDKIIINELIKKDIWGWADKRGFPSILLFAFNKEVINKITWDFSPRLSKVNGNSVERSEKIKVVDERTAKMFNRDIGTCVKCDTAWRIPEFISKACLKYGCAERVLPMSKKHLIPYKNRTQMKICHGMDRKEHMCEYHWNGELFGSHMQASRTFALDSLRGQIWQNRIGDYIQSKYSLEENNV